MAYSQDVLDHFHNPRNVGELDPQSPRVGTALVGAPSCGDVVKLQIEVDENNRIQKAVFKAFGCGSAMAAASYTTVKLQGLSLEEASHLENQVIAEALSLPPVKIHCSVLAAQAIKKATEDFLQKQKTFVHAS
jgi:Fe-S cluster assembly scaffold IscU